MTFNLMPVAPADALALLPLLRDADEGEERLRAALCDPAHTAYAATDSAARLGAAVVRWEPAASEILLLAVAPAMRGRGIGRAILAALVAEGRRRGTEALLVGTANCALGNIAFYQRCGFRMDHVRRDYFAYVQPPISENGIPLIDMIVFRRTLAEG
jgi:GNAT superfamily N-acetyltransferase